MAKTSLTSLLCLLAVANGLQLSPALGTSTPRLAVRRAVGPSCQFGEPENKGGLTRDNEPEEFFKTNMDDMTDAEKLKLPGVWIGLSVLVLPFFAGLIALQIYK
uniref:Photosystem I reaction center subunit VIII n=1 Tax=Prymnesium polylepis TaxID=72548 RepID=A0A7S4MDA1_9EUKA